MPSGELSEGLMEGGPDMLTNVVGSGLLWLAGLHGVLGRSLPVHRLLIDINAVKGPAFCSDSYM